jgi:hypothetical protein
MKSAPINIHEWREKMNRFNEWEISFLRKLTSEERCQQFVDLFELAMMYDTETIERAHQEHLQQLTRLSTITTQYIANHPQETPPQLDNMLH